MSTAVATGTQTHYTPEDLLAMPDGKDYELVGGQLMERKTGAESSWIGGTIFCLLETYCSVRALGWNWPADNGYQCFPHDPGMVRKPDASFIRRGRLPGEQIPRGFIRIPPDLAVEVVSPNDLASEVEEKLSDYLKADVPLIWVIYPETRTVTVLHGDGSATRLNETDELSGEDVIPGFRCLVDSLFPPKAGPTE